MEKYIFGKNGCGMCGTISARHSNHCMKTRKLVKEQMKQLKRSGKK